MGLKSVMQHQFSQIPRADIPRSSFNRSHGHKTTFDAGYLVPIFVDEALPGDTFNLRASILARLSTPIYPLMDNMFLETFFFAVPVRLLWDHWVNLHGEKVTPSDSTEYVCPTITSGAAASFAVGSLSDYFGLPTGVNNIEVCSFWHRAYNLIWNEWFRDENLQNPVKVDTDDGPDAIADYVLLRRGKRHDYFTSCLPWPQKGPGVELPLGSSAPVFGTGKTIGLTDGTNILGLKANLTSVAGAYNTNIGTTTGGGVSPIANSNIGLVTSGTSGLYADLSNATAATISSLREAFQMQRLYERDARGGSRYCELLRSHFGVVSPDFRLQRPEYLGGSSSPVTISTVPQTSSTDATTPQGNLSAFGVVSDHFHGFTKSFTEHCVIIGMANVRADLTYQQGIPRMFSRSTRFDFYYPSLAHLGEQAVLNKEIYAQGTAVDDNVFGYQERWSEYRYKPSIITGQLRSTFATPLDAWHLSQEFSSLPVLNASFIQDDPPIDRVVAVPAEPHFIFDSYFSLNCVRPMPVYSVPGLVDHF